jgi:hypothetical protein
MPDAAAFKMRRRGRLNARIVIRGGGGADGVDAARGMETLCSYGDKE